MFTREDYMEGKCTHDEYYAQFLGGENSYTNAFDLILGRWKKEEIKKAYKEDPSFNTLPLNGWNVIGWDVLSESLICRPFREFGDVPILAGKVCILKRAAKIIATEP